MATTIADLGRGHEFTGKLLRVLAEDGLNDEVPSILVNDRKARHLAVQFLNILAGSSGTVPSYQRARDILGDDFISPQEVAEARGVSYTEVQLSQLASTLPSKEVLQWARDNGFAVVAGPPSEMNILGIRDLNPQLFWSKQSGWYAESSEKFARKDTTGTTWLVLRKDPVTNSTRKTWSEQQELLTDVERVPNAAEAAWFFTTYAAVRGTRLVPNGYVRTSSVDSDGDHVHVGFDDGGLGVSSSWYGYCGDGIGVASARK
ncbi:MAG: hypothetical protein A3H51_02045 [Candidatus Spechtbacteria bacterium RIFCSPLOWO2_02_FULL_38_8]|uniref:Uncharacterized protein n=1 Tax=Candidatus Spechtbacteria bacterium RIFCSPLOWO2_02_FULL_38_8 TaxID=1802164 RepID=A0A1G2HGH4_9BACT|nr:MAG: hypothetical protein A3H51_02045 [Candidatus Spechtbacteria bacterium RIFCSPLOWO2_02_FULL_38_8]